MTSVRAHLDLDNPTRFHRDLLRGLRIPPSASLLEVSRTWQQQFSVERVTTKFYREYAAVRDRVAKALLAHNQDHPVVKSFTLDEARAWATRQMGRVLFLWFLQAKRWLGEPGGQGSITYLLDLWARRSQTRRGRILSRHSVSDVFRRYGDREQQPERTSRLGLRSLPERWSVQAQRT